MRAVRLIPERIHGRHVFLALCAFFGVMFIVDGVFLYLALATHTGGETSPYRRGLDYNKTIAEADRQQAQGWRATLTYMQSEGLLSFDLKDSSGVPVAGLKIEAIAGRPATSKDDTLIQFEEMSSGTYTAQISLAPGQWVVALAALAPRHASAPVYRLKQRLFVAENR